MKITYSKDNTHIEDSYKLTDRKMIAKEVDIIREERYIRRYPVTRTKESYINEWVAHNKLYERNYKVDHTKDVDIEEPGKWYLEIIWFILGGI